MKYVRFNHDLLKKPSSVLLSLHGKTKAKEPHCSLECQVSQLRAFRITTEGRGGVKVIQMCRGGPWFLNSITNPTKNSEGACHPTMQFSFATESGSSRQDQIASIKPPLQLLHFLDKVAYHKSHFGRSWRARRFPRCQTIPNVTRTSLACAFIVLTAETKSFRILGN